MLLVPLITGYLNRFCPPMVAIGPQSFSRILQLVRPATLSTYFLQGMACWHMASATWPQSLYDWHHRLSAVLVHRTNPRQSRSAQPFVLQVPKCLDRCTDKQVRPTFCPSPTHDDFTHQPGPNRTSRSGAMSEFMKSRGTCLWHVPREQHHRFSKRILSPVVAIGQQSLSRTVH